MSMAAFNNIEDEDVIANIDVTPPGGYLANMRAPRCLVFWSWCRVLKKPSLNDSAILLTV